LTEIRIRKFNEKTKAWDYEVLPYDHKTLGVFFRPSTATGNVVGAYVAPEGSYATITGIKMIADSADTWFSFSGDYHDLAYLPAKGAEIIEGDAENPVVVLNPGESIVAEVTNATASNYAVVIYGFVRPIAPTR